VKCKCENVKEKRWRHTITGDLWDC